MKCGTYAGYKVHRKNKEPICPECRIALNVYRRDYHRRNPHKNKQHKARQKAKQLSTPEAQARLAARQAKREARQRTVLLNRIRIILNKQIRKQIQEEKKATALEIQAQKIFWESHKRQVERDVLELRALRRKLQFAKNRLIREADAAYRRLERVQAVEARKKALEEKRQARKSLRDELSNQHGVSIGDYGRCKARNGTACDLCKAKAAEYMRNKKHEPKYKEYRRGHNRRRDRRVRANGFEFYRIQDVLDRWGYDCHICKAPINFKAPRQCGDPGWEEGFHLDHVIPLSKGGKDIVENVKPAHAKCNVLRGDKAIV